MKTKINDVILILIIICVAVFFLLIRYSREDGQSIGNSVEVMVDGKLLGIFPLDKPAEMIIDAVGGYNHMIIEDGRVLVHDSDCSDLICVKQGGINKVGESIICLPHRVVISVAGKGEPEYDSVTN